MNQTRFPLAPLWLAIALAVLPALSAQEAPPAPAVAPEQPTVAPVAPPVEPPAPAVEPAAPAVDQAPVSVEPPAAVKPEAVATSTGEPEPGLAPAEGAAEQAESGQAKPRHRRAGSGQETPPHFGTQTITDGSKQRGAVSIGGDTIVDGDLAGEAVSVLGNTTVNATLGNAAVSVLGNTTVNGVVGDAAVSVLGTTTVNGRVKGSVVAVLGDVVLGPGAVVGGEVVAVLGAVRRAPGAQVGGGVQQIGGGLVSLGDFEWIRAYVMECVRWGRPLAFGDHLGWAWGVAALFLLFYALLALLFPRGIERCAEALEEKPGGTILAALLAALLSPILFVLLAITGIGLVLVPFLAAAGFFATLFGKAAMLAWFGRRVVAPFGSVVPRHAAFSVLIGGLIVALLYCIPFLGILLWKLFGVLGLGMVVYVLAGTMRREQVAPAPAAQSAGAGGAGPFAAQFAATAAAAPEPPPAGPVFTPGFGAAPQPPPVQPLVGAAILPRAGFWIRTAAAFLDCLMIAVTLGILDLFDNGPGLLFFFIAVYSAVMWKLKGTTIGGVICGLRVVRLDDRPIDWGVAIVRTLSAFLSLFVAGLGFIWVAFDDERQSWHDKIAGTTIVRVPKGTALL